MHEYRCTIRRVVDGDTVDVDIDLGFGIWVRNERVRLYGIDTPESRTRDLEEKKCGIYASIGLKTLASKPCCKCDGMLLCYAYIICSLWKMLSEIAHPSARGHCRGDGDNLIILHCLLNKSISKNISIRWQSLAR